MKKDIFHLFASNSQILLVIFFLTCSVSADVIKKNFFHSQTNWTELHLSVVTKEAIPPIDLNSSISNLAEARLVAYERAEKTNRSRLNIAMESLIWNEDYTLMEYMEEDSRFKESFIRYFNSQPEKKTRYFDKKDLVLTSHVDFLGNKNLFSLLYNEFGGEDLPTVRDELPEEVYTGYLIDARGMDVTPALFPKIQTEDGRDVFSKNIALPTAVQEIGLLRYVNNESHRLVRQRIGNNPLRLVPIRMEGKNKTNIILPLEEMKKILSSPKNRKNWRLCKIIVLVDEKDP